MNEQQLQQKKDIHSSDQDDLDQQDELQSDLIQQQRSRKSNYDEILDISLISPRTKQEMINELKKNGIIYKEERYLQSMTPYQLWISKINHTKNYEIVTLTILIGPFEQQVTILNVFKQSFIQRLEPLFYQGHTNIYLFTYRQHEYICKATSYSDSHLDLRKQEIIQSLRQYCITNIMSTLKIGPKLSKSFYFDLIVSQSGVQFYLEHCIHYAQKIFTNHDEIVMKTHLKEMHSLGFLHRDIKPNNIMFSKYYDKFVYIDFGISQFRRQKPGDLIKSKFLGTYAYCTQQFKKLFNSRQSDWVDAYLNDAWGLRVSISQMKKARDNQILIAQNSSSHVSNQLLSHTDLIERQIKHFIYSNQIEKIGQIINMKESAKNFQRKILNFFYEVPATQSLRKFYLKQIDDDIKKEKIFSQLWECFKTPVYIQSYKGIRTFLTIQEQKSNLRFQQIYSKIKDKYTNIANDLKILKREFEELLTNKVLIGEMSLRQYQKRFIEFVNFTNLKWQSSLQQKLVVCKKYVQNFNVKIDPQQLTDRQFIQQVLYQMSISWLEDQHIKSWDTVIKIIQNYFIVMQKVKFNITEYLMKFIDNIWLDSNMKNIKKVERMLDIVASRKFLVRRYKCLIEWAQSDVIEQVTENRIKQIIKQQKQNQSDDVLLFQFFLKAFQIYKNQITSDFFENSLQVVKEIKWLRTDYPQLQRIFNFIEFHIGVFLERNDRIDQGRKLNEENSLRQITRQGELNVICFEMIRNYELTLQVKKMKKYISLVDQSINCKDISYQYFTKLRIFIEIYFKNYDKAKELLKKYEIFAHVNCNFFLAMNTYQWAIKMIIMHKMSYINLLPQFQSFFRNSEKVIIAMTKQYEKLKQPLIYYESKNWFYLCLLQYTSRIQADTQAIVFIDRQKLTPPKQITRTQSFKKLMSIKRDQFTTLDHVLLFFNDIQVLRARKKYKQMVNYVKDRRDLIEHFLLKANRQQKTRLIHALSLIIYSLGFANSAELLNEYMEYVILVLRNPRLGCMFFIEDFQQQIAIGLTKTNHFDFITQALITANKYYSHHVSNSNIPIICRFYSNIASSVLLYYKQKQMVQQLRIIFPMISPKQYPIFSIFLLFFIYPCNREKILKFLYKSLDYINHTGRWIILSRLYKQQIKMKKVSRWRKIYLIKKDIIYPSRYKVNLYKLKAKLNLSGQLNNFGGIFMQKLEKKLVKLGICCDIYSQIKIQNQINHVLNLKQLDMLTRQLITQQWQTQVW